MVKKKTKKYSVRELVNSTEKTLPWLLLPVRFKQQIVF